MEETRAVTPLEAHEIAMYGHVLSATERRALGREFISRFVKSEFKMRSIQGVK